MRILILTSKNHIYANVVLTALMQHGIVAGDQATIVEQDGLLSGKRMSEGLWKYLRVSGLKYVATQACKQYLFRIRRCIDGWMGNRNSPYFPYRRVCPTSIRWKNYRNMHAPEVIQQVRELKPDLLLSIFSKELLPTAILQIPLQGAVNLHPSLLPAYRGVSPTFWCLANGEKRTGITLHALDEGIDTGTVIVQKEIPLGAFTTEHALYLHCARLGSALLTTFLEQLRRNCAPTPQSVSMAPAECYVSLPILEAIQRFHRGGYRFFRLWEFLSPP